MDTITCTVNVEVPVVRAILDGNLLNEPEGQVDSFYCDHSGAAWSDNLNLRCPHCAAPMFLPPRVLANLPTEQIGRMERAWVTAGWPAYDMAADAWRLAPGWTLVPHPDFDRTGGCLAVRDNRLHLFPEA